MRLEIHILNWVPFSTPSIASGGADRLQLPIGSSERLVQRYWWRESITGRAKRLIEQTVIFWNNFVQQPTDIACSVILAAILMAVFVAENSGIILSACIVSNNVAIASSQKCSIPMNPPFFVSCSTCSPTLAQDPSGSNSLADRAATYAKQCYHTAVTSTAGCNYFYNQSLSYRQKLNESCPFTADHCLSPAYTLDTGLVDAKYLGINTRSKYAIRRRTTCVPTKGRPNLRRVPEPTIYPWAVEAYPPLSDDSSSRELQTGQIQDMIIDQGIFRLWRYAQTYRHTRPSEMELY